MNSDPATLHALLVQGSLTCDLSDVGNGIAVLPMTFAWRSNGEPFFGPAHTITAPHEDLDAVYKGIRTAEAGSVLVVETGGTERAIWGENTTREALLRGVAGVVLDGACRDVKALRRSGLAVVARGVNPKRAERTNEGDIGGTLWLHGVTIRQGDLIVSDENGTVVVPSDKVDQLIKTVTRMNREAEDDVNG